MARHFVMVSQLAADGIVCQAVFKDAYFVLFLSPFPPGSQGEGPDCHIPKEIKGLGPIPARIQGGTYLFRK